MRATFCCSWPWRWLQPAEATLAGGGTQTCCVHALVCRLHFRGGYLCPEILAGRVGWPGAEPAKRRRVQVRARGGSFGLQISSPTFGPTFEICRARARCAHARGPQSPGSPPRDRLCAGARAPETGQFSAKKPTTQESCALAWHCVQFGFTIRRDRIYAVLYIAAKHNQAESSRFTRKNQPDHHSNQRKLQINQQQQAFAILNKQAAAAILITSTNKARPASSTPMVV